MEFGDETAATQRALWPGQGRRSASAQLPGGPAAGRARRALRAGLSRQRRRRPGTRTATSRRTTPNCAQVDQPIAGAAEGPQAARAARRDAGRLGHRVRPHAGLARAAGRDHHPYGFSVWMAGGGMRRRGVHGATDELGFHAVENRHYVTDIHATVLHSWASTPAAWKCPAASGWTSTSANRSAKS